MNNLTLAIGLLGASAVIVLQSLLVLGVIPFDQQIVLVVPAFLVTMLWFVLSGHLGRTDARIPTGVVLHVLAGLVFGYPVWAFRLGQNLKSTMEAEQP